MRRLFALILTFTLWVGFAAPASADVAGLVPCSESPAFQARAAQARATTADPESGTKRFERYGAASCGADDGLPRIIADGRLSHVGDFTIPGLMFLYIAGWIGNAGRAYLIANKKEKNPGEGEININVSLAVGCMMGAAAWPLTAFREFSTGQLTVPDDEITVSPR
ncbi:MAG: Photosystem I reaction center subunit III [Cyanobacteria bacterium P01_A01_bin.17]